MQILNLHYNEGFGKGIIMLAMVGWILLTIFGSFALICFHHVLDTLELIIVTFLPFFSLVATLTLLSSTNSVSVSSQDFLSQLLQRNPTKRIKRSINAAKPLRLYFGNLFYSQPHTVLTCLVVITNNVITLVVGYGG